jgi:hypothetical protein
MDPLLISVLIIAGFFFGLISLMVGIGGGLLNVPFLIYGVALLPNVTSLSPIDATLVSSFTIMFTSFSGSLKNRSENRIDFRTAGIFLMFAIPGSILGGWIATLLDASLLKTLFAVLVGVSAIRGIYKAQKSGNNDNDGEKFIPGKEYRKIQTIDGKIFEYNVKIGVGRIFAFLGGFVAGLLGIGGGIIYVPLLTMIAGIPIHITVATSSAMIVIVTIFAFATKSIALNAQSALDPSLLLTFGIPLALGSIVGARIGAGRIKKLNSKMLLTMFWSIAFLSAIRMLIG